MNVQAPQTMFLGLFFKLQMHDKSHLMHYCSNYFFFSTLHTFLWLL